jgi:3-oxoacyl-[acyl-carrier protein] reductase
LKFSFGQRHVVVTGGAQGIGFEIAQQFLQAGASVTIWDYSQLALDQAREALRSFSSNVKFSAVDVSKAASCIEAAKSLQQPVDVLVNNAGITRDKSLAKMTDEDFQSVIATNLTGLFNVTKSLLESFNKQSKQLRIINMSSVVALYGNFGQTNYVAAKAGVIGLTKTWARELGRKGFTVNAIAPGFTKTSMVEAMPEDVLKGMADKVAVQRLGAPADIANACLFLASQEASYINGAVLSVDGGLTT